MKPFTSAAILGAGSLGTALAKLLAPKLESVLLVSIEQECVDGINRDHRNPKYLTDISLGDNVRATGDHREALGMPLVIFAVPTVGVRSEAEKLAALGLPVDRVNIKATTNEKLGFIGRGDGIAALAVAALDIP